MALLKQEVQQLQTSLAQHQMIIRQISTRNMGSGGDTNAQRESQKLMLISMKRESQHILADRSSPKLYCRLSLRDDQFPLSCNIFEDSMREDSSNDSPSQLCHYGERESPQNTPIRDNSTNHQLVDVTDLNPEGVQETLNKGGESNFWNHIEHALANTLNED